MNDKLNNTYSRLNDDTISTSKSVLESRSQRTSQMDTINKMQKENLQDLQAMIDSLSKIEKLRSVDEATLKRLKALESEIRELNKNKNKSYEDTLALLEETNKELEKGIKLREKQLDLDDVNFDNKIRALRKQRDLYDDNLDYISKAKKINTEANRSLYDEFTKNLSVMRQQVRDLAIFSGVETLNGKKGQIENYNNILGQYGYSGMSYSQLKFGAMGTLNNNFGIQGFTKFGFNDVLDYMSRLEDLGIANLEIARQQADDIMFGAKYLGMSVETQGKILKQARDTGNMNLLTESNKALVQIMKSELSISKQQLEKLSNQGASLAQLTTFFGGEAGTAFTKGLAAIEYMYGKGTGESVGNIASRILSNDTSLLQYLPNFYGIQSKLASGDASALDDIVKSVQSSGYINAIRSSGGKMGIIDKDLMSISTSRNTTGTDYTSAVDYINGQDGSTKGLLNNLKIGATDVIKNVSSWITSIAPIQSLQAMYYPLAIADLLASTPIMKGLGKFFTGTFKKIFPGIAGDISNISSALGGTEGISLGGSVISLLGKTVPILSTIAGVVMAISDGIAGYNKKDDWGTSGISSIIGGLLGGTDENEGSRMATNALKYAAIGLGIGAKFGGWKGALIGGILGAVVGAGIGAIGGENIATGIDSMFGLENSGGVNTAPVTNLSNARGGAYTGKGGNAMGNFPWTLTSPFGYRGSFQTSAGWTNPYHNGIDLASKSGTPIGANNSGTVSAVGTDGSRGNYAIINSGDGYEQVYYHMLEPSKLVKGQSIFAGQQVGLMGSTGMSTGTHLHFGMRKAGTNDYIDPQPRVNTELFNVSATGTMGLGVIGNDATAAALLLSQQQEDELKASTLLTKTIDADTVGNYGGIGGEGIIDSVNSGFASLIEKLEELSQRQDDQEQILSVLAGGSNQTLLKW